MRVLGRPGGAAGEKMIELELKLMRDNYLSSSSSSFPFPSFISSFFASPPPSSFDSVKKFHEIVLSTLDLPWEQAKKQIKTALK